MNKLFKLDNTSEIRVWEIHQDDDGLVIQHGKLNGRLIVTNEAISKGKAGRSWVEQVQSRIESRISKQLDKGYKYTIEEARKGATNQLNLLRPMLAQPIKNIKNIDWSNAFLQCKYDGHRCLVTNQNGKIIAYSRNGKIIDTIDHIIADLPIPNGWTLDGELYYHGESLQTLTSWIKRKQPDNLKLKYHVYDVINDSPYKERLNFLCTLINQNVVIVPTSFCKCIDHIKRALPVVINQGYEGIILRQGNLGYEANKRSTSLIKIKKFLDDEFEIIDITSSKDGWAILHCFSKFGDMFKVSAPGSIAEKTRIYRNKESYIGLYVRIEYANLTKNNIPFHPVAIAFRNKEEE